MTGTVPQGTFSANKLRADLEERTVTLDGNARLRIVPQRAEIAAMRATHILAALARRFCCSATAVAQSAHNSNAPIDFGADHIELQDKANRAILSGNVAVKQAEMTLNSARMTVAYTGQVDRRQPAGLAARRVGRRDRQAARPDRAQPVSRSTTSTAASSRCSAR